MASWQTVRYDSSYEEKIDPEILELCDVLNGAGFETAGSCCGHGFGWPYVFLIGDVDDERCEALARFLLKNADSYLPRMQKEILETGHEWSLRLALHNMYGDTPQKEAFALAEKAISHVSTLIRSFGESEKGGRL